MNCSVQLSDLINNEIVFKGISTISSLKNNGLCIEMKRADSSYCWKCFEKGLIIESVSDYKVVMTLKENATTKSHIETEFGTIYLQYHTSLYKMNRNCIEVEYELVQEDESQKFHFLLEIYKEEEHAIH